METAFVGGRSCRSRRGSLTRTQAMSKGPTAGIAPFGGLGDVAGIAYAVAG